jgi:hypothetical protein
MTELHTSLVLPLFYEVHCDICLLPFSQPRVRNVTNTNRQIKNMPIVTSSKGSVFSETYVWQCRVAEPSLFNTLTALKTMLEFDP